MRRNWWGNSQKMDPRGLCVCVRINVYKSREKTNKPLAV